MANVTEWFKGILFFIFITMMFYFLWQYIFSNVIEFVGSDVFGIGTEASASISILKAVAWVSFIFLYLSVGGVYLVYSIIVGSQGNVETNPLEFIKAIGLWTIIMPVLTFFYGLSHFLVDSLSDTNILETAMNTEASNFSWIFSLIILVVLVAVPFIYVLKGYGVNIWGQKEENKG